MAKSRNKRNKALSSNTMVDNTQGTVKDEIQALQRDKRSVSEILFDNALELFGADIETPIAEHRFAPPRRWRFDRCWIKPSQMLAVEIEGGVWTGGRHTRGKGYTADVEKYNAAVLAGWRVLRFTSNMLEDDPVSCVDMIRQALGVEDKAA